jgi:hypothetical protein
MFKKIGVTLTLLSASLITGCASVLMASSEADQAKKEFSAPSDGKSGLYIYRNSSLGAALKKQSVLMALLSESQLTTLIFIKS